MNLAPKPFLYLPGTASPTSPSVSDLLAQHYTADEIGGPSVFGWHALSLFMTCERKAYLSMIRKLEQVDQRPGREIGILVHACLARHYKTGGVETWKPLEIVEGDYPEMAHETRRILAALFAKHGEEEAQTWDIRAVEHAVTAKIRGIGTEGPFAGMRISCPISCRFDLIVALKKPEDAPGPLGLVETGVYIVDHKTTSSISRTSLTGYSLDGQILMNCLIWRLAKLDKVFGPLKGFIVNIIAKTKEIRVERLRIATTEEDLDRFIAMIRPKVLEAWSRLHAPHKRNESRWPMNLTSCRTGFGTLCDYFDYCESHGRAGSLYKIKGSR